MAPPATPASRRGGGPEPRHRVSWPRRPADRYVFTIGLASIALGVAMTVYTVQALPGVGSFGLVPEAMAGFALVVLGAIAVVLTRPPGATDLNRAAAWTFLAAGIVATATVVVLAVDDLAGPIASERAFAGFVVVLGRSVIQAGVVGLVVLGVLGLLRAAWRRFLGPWVVRWFH